jgi:hypothetical protein
LNSEEMRERAEGFVHTSAHRRHWRHVRCVDGSQEVRRSLRIRASTLTELDGFVLAPMQVYRVRTQHDTQSMLRKSERLSNVSGTCRCALTY